MSHVRFIVHIVRNTKSHTNTEKNKLQNTHSHLQIDGHTHFEWEWGHLLGLNQSRTENTTPIPDYNSCTQPTKFYVHHLLSSQSSWSMSLSRNLPLSRPANNTYQNKMRNVCINTLPPLAPSTALPHNTK